jgi:hypothetical protein
MLNHAGFENGRRSGIWAECARTVTFLSNITASKQRRSALISYCLGASLKYLQVLEYLEKLAL